MECDLLHDMTAFFFPEMACFVNLCSCRLFLILQSSEQATVHYGINSAEAEYLHQGRFNAC